MFRIALVMEPLRPPSAKTLGRKQFAFRETCIGPISLKGPVDVGHGQRRKRIPRIAHPAEIRDQIIRTGQSVRDRSSLSPNKHGRE